MSFLFPEEESGFDRLLHSMQSKPEMKATDLVSCCFKYKFSGISVLSIYVHHYMCKLSKQYSLSINSFSCL